MNPSFVILAVFVACCYGLPMGDVAENENSNFIAIPVEKLKKIIREGNSKLGIPKLDPLEVEEYPLSLNEENVISVDGLLKNLEVDGVSEFGVKKAEFNMVGLKLEFHAIWHSIRLHTAYNVKGMLVDLAPLYGKGTVSAEVNDIDVNIKLKLGMNNGKLYAKSLTTAVHLGGLKLDITGLYYDEEVSDLASRIVSDMAPQFVEDYQTQLTEQVNKMATNMLNEFLADKTLKDLLELLN